ncbi:MAG: MFS transporter [Parvularculaceae bacterium]|nr:MFS transporter [Parvularculaceae bacterium]
MFRAVSALVSLLAAAAILFAGNGLQGTLLAVRGDLEGFSTPLIGILMSCYFAGFILGCRINPTFVKSVGHIRTFIALASIASAVTLVHPLVVDVAVWGLLRACTGFCFAGMIMVIESWINERAENSSRGRVLAVYRLIDMSATVGGNALLSIASPQSFELFAIVSILVSLALVPVALTRAPAPRPIETARLNVPRLFQVSPLAAIGAPLIGLANASFWAVGPVYVQAMGYDKDVVAWFMSAVVVGAGVMVFPLGAISDRIDRRHVMIGAAICGSAAALALGEFGGKSAATLVALAGLFGAFIIPMFGIAAAHANDRADRTLALETNGGLLLLHSCGSIVGATAGAVVMAQFGPGALFHYIAIVYIAFAAVCLYRVLRREAPARQAAPGLAHPGLTPDAR